MAPLRFFADYHTHTRRSDGAGTALDNARAARAAGLTEVALTDHGPAAMRVGVRGLDSLRGLIAEVRRAERELGGLAVLAGVECNVVDLDGGLDVPDHLLAEFDIVLVGLHLWLRPAWLRGGAALVWPNVLGPWLGPRARARVRADNTRALVAAVNRHRVDIVTHPGLHLDVDTAALARACAARGTALEVSCGHPFQTVEWVRLAAAEGADFVVNTDAHHPAAVGRLERGARLLERAGIGPERVINAIGHLPAGRPSRFLQRRREHG